MSQRAYEIFGQDFHVVGSIDAERFELLVRLLDKLAKDLRKDGQGIKPEWTSETADSQPHFP
jgi:hypothetical protein